MSLDELVENFSFLSDWEDKYRYLIELGNTLPPMSITDKNDSTKVDGCMAQVWISATKQNDRFFFSMDSDAHIVRGLQAVLFTLINGKTSAEIQSMNLGDIFTQLGLQEHLSPNRRNGFNAMLNRINLLIRE